MKKAPRPKGPAAAEAAGGKFVIRTDKITSLDGMRAVCCHSIGQHGEGNGVAQFGGPERGGCNPNESDGLAIIHC